jgi:hypothetical protein
MRDEDADRLDCDGPVDVERHYKPE